MGSSSHISCPICRASCSRDAVVRVQFIDRQIANLAVKCPNFRYYKVQQARDLQEKAQIRRSARLKEKQKDDAEDSDDSDLGPTQRICGRKRRRSRTTHDTSSSSRLKRTKFNDDDDAADDDAQSEEGCVWTGRYSEIAHHRRICPFEIQKCQFRCGASLLPRELRTHYEVCSRRPLRCSLCGQDELMKSTMQAHLASDCPMVKIMCDCGDKVPRKDITEHRRKVCREARMPCPYHHIGCDKLIKRKDEVEHCRSHVYLHLGRVYAFANKQAANADRLEQENKDLRRFVFAMDYRLRKLEKKPRRQTIEERLDVCNRSRVLSLRGVLSDEEDA